VGPHRPVSSSSRSSAAVDLPSAPFDYPSGRPRRAPAAAPRARPEDRAIVEGNEKLGDRAGLRTVNRAIADKKIKPASWTWPTAKFIVDEQT